jgi:aminoglycoside/choline kinase family phosphotransferase
MPSDTVSAPGTDARLPLVQAFVARHAAAYGLDPASLAPASADASFRRYFRVLGSGPHPSLIVMDAPPSHEDVRPFVHVARLLGAAGVLAPQVLEEDAEGGFLLLTDLGHTTYLAALRQAPERADALYRDAAHCLVRLQQASRPGELPPYDRERLLAEMQLFPTWYVERHLDRKLEPAQAQALQQVFEQILANNLAQPAVTVHRDYHSRNLMLAAENNPGVLDFQDAVHGPITYDLASLLRDAYVEWEEPQQIDWAVRYWEAARKAGLPVVADFGDFYRDFEWMGLQRHIKVLGIFARLYHRDGKDGYLKDLPLVWRYARKVAERYNALAPLARLFDTLEGKAPQAGYTF